VVCELYPEVERHIEWLGNFGKAMMTGSGACVFAEFSSRNQAEEVLRHIPHEMRGMVVQGLAIHPMQDWVTD